MSARRRAPSGGGCHVSEETGRSAFQDRSASPKCRDFRADFGPYVTTYNYDAYQDWYWDNAIAHTALRQRATKLCLTLRNGQPTMKPCSAADQAALWAIDDTSTAGALIKDKVSGTCRARRSNDRRSLAAMGRHQRLVITHAY